MTEERGMKVEELMTRAVRTCRPQDSLNDAVRTMWEHDCGCLPVVDEGERVVGVVTDRDACMCAYLRGASLKDLHVGHAMSREVRSCKTTDSVDEAASRMARAQVRRVPVVDEDGRLRGMVTLLDLARFADEKRRKGLLEQVAHTLAEVGQPRRPSLEDVAAPHPSRPRPTRAASEPASSPPPPPRKR
jgi:CBS domain-containing protein